jgi:hypothetical protein
VNELYATQYLFCDHEGGLEGEPTTTDIQIFFKGVSEELGDQESEIAVLSEPDEVGYAYSSL